MRIPWEQISLHDGFKNKPNLSQFELFFYQFSKEAGFVWLKSTLTSISNKHFHLTHYREKLLKKTVTQKYQSNSIFGQFLRYLLPCIKCLAGQLSATAYNSKACARWLRKRMHFIEPFKKTSKRRCRRG